MGKRKRGEDAKNPLTLFTNRYTNGAGEIGGVEPANHKFLPRPFSWGKTKGCEKKLLVTTTLRGKKSSLGRKSHLPHITSPRAAEGTVNTQKFATRISESGQAVIGKRKIDNVHNPFLHQVGKGDYGRPKDPRTSFMKGKSVTKVKLHQIDTS